MIAGGGETGGGRIDDFRGLGKRAPFLSLGTALCLLSLAGIPPMAGFVSKLFIFTAAWGESQSLLAQGNSLLSGWLVALVVIGLINSLISLVYYGRIVKAMYFYAPLKQDHLPPPFRLTPPLT